MNSIHFRHKALVLARQIYPNLDGDTLIAEAERIYQYLSSNNYQNFIGLNMVTDDVLSFAELLSLTDAKDNPIQLRDYQQKLLTDWQTGNDNVVLHARKMGITLCLCLYVLWLTCFKKQVHLGFVVTSLDKMRTLSRMIYTIHENSKFDLPTIKEFNVNSIGFSNGNKIQFLRPNTLVIGHSLTHVVADNVAQIPYADDENFYSTIMFSNKGQLIAASTPGCNIGIFYDLATTKIINSPITSIPWYLNKELDTKWAFREKREIGASTFANQYECQFVDVRS